MTQASPAETTAAPDRDPRFLGRLGESLDVRLYRRMFFIRRFEERILDLFEEGRINGTTHACIGQEADAVGVVEHVTADDHIFSNHRCHGHYLALTGDAYGLLAEMLGRPDGVTGGIGGSQHLCAPGFKSNGVLGGTVPAAAGIALAKKLSGGAGISVAFMGDGALGEGVVYETFNIASLWQLPLLFVLEDNGWSQSTPAFLNRAGEIARRFEAFEIPVDEMETTDVREIVAASKAIVDDVRAQQRPRALVIQTYRLCHHSKSDDHRPEEEVAARWATEPLRVHGRRIDGDLRRGVETEVESALAEVFDRALGS